MELIAVPEPFNSTYNQNYGKDANGLDRQNILLDSRISCEGNILSFCCLRKNNTISHSRIAFNKYSKNISDNGHVILKVPERYVVNK